MRSRSVVFILMILLSLSLTGCKQIGKIENAACSALPEGDMQEHCYQDAAVRAQEATICESITGDEFTAAQGNPRRNKCYRRVAEKTGDFELCDKLTPGSMAETKNGCFMLVAISELDASICDHIDDNYMKTRCREEVEKIFPYCVDEKDDITRYNQCILETAIDEEKISYCDKHANPSLCVIGFNDELMKRGELLGVDECKRLNDVDARYTCSLLYAHGSGDDSNCDSIPDSNYARLCTALSWSEIGPGQDPDFRLDPDKRDSMIEHCDSIADTRWKGMCFGMLANTLETEWDGGIGNYNFDVAQHIQLKKDAYISFLEFCSNDAFFSSDSLANTEMLETMCLLKTMTLSDPSVCSELTGDAKTECEDISPIDTGVCPEEDDACKEFILPIHQDVLDCKKHEVDGRPTVESLRCEEKVKSAHFIKLYSISKEVQEVDGVPIETITSMLIEG